MNKKLLTTRYKRQTNPGFTLVEFLLYLALVSITVLVISFFLSQLMQSKVKSQTIAEVEQQGVQINQIISQTIRNAKQINSPLTAAIANSLSLTVVDSAKTPTVFSIINGEIQITEGASQSVSLNNSRVEITSLNFQNLSQNNTAGTIRTQFTISYRNPGLRNEFSYSKTFYSSATIR